MICENEENYLAALGFDFSPQKLIAKPKPNKIEPKWNDVINQMHTYEQTNEHDVEWLTKFLTHFSRYHLVHNYKSIYEYVIKAVKVDDIDPNECSTQHSNTKI